MKSLEFYIVSSSNKKSIHYLDTAVFFHQIDDAYHDLNAINVLSFQKTQVSAFLFNHLDNFHQHALSIKYHQYTSLTYNFFIDLILSQNIYFTIQKTS